MKLRDALRMCGSAVLLVAALGVRSSYAEPEAIAVVYHGVPLTVEERLSAGGDLLKIVLGGEAFLVSVTEAPRQVALRYLIRPEVSARLSGKEVESIAIASSLQGDSEVLQAAVRIGMTSSRALEFDSRELWQKLMSTTEMEPTVWGAVKTVGEQALERRLCAASAVIESKFQEGQLQERGTPGDTGVRDFVSAKVANMCITQVIAHTFEQLWSGRLGVELADELLSDAAPFMKKVGERGGVISSTGELLRSLASAVEQVDSGRFEQLLDSLRKESESSGVRPDVAVARQVFLTRAITAGAFRSAIEQLAQVPFEQRSSLTHSQLVKSLRGLPSADWGMLLDSGIRPAIARYVVKDEEFYSQWVSTHRRVIGGLVAEGKVDSAWSVAAVVLKEDSAVASKVLAETSKVIVQGYLDRGDVVKAGQVAGELVVWLPWTTRLRVSLASRGLSIPGLCGVLVGFVVAVKMFSNRKRRKSGVKLAAAAAGAGPTDDTTERTPADANEMSTKEQPEESQKFSREYVASLRLFGLEPGATLAQIKNAYRSAVKQYHPDRAGGGTAGDTDLFIRLTEEYEKLLDLHEREARSVDPSSDIS